MTNLAAVLTRWISPGVLSSVGLLIAAAAVLWLGQAAPAAGFAIAPRWLASLSAVPPMLVIGLGAGLPWGSWTAFR